MLPVVRPVVATSSESDGENGTGQQEKTCFHGSIPFDVWWHRRGKRATQKCGTSVLRKRLMDNKRGKKAMIKMSVGRSEGLS